MFKGTVKRCVYLVVVSQQLVKKVQGLSTDKVLVVVVDKSLPSLARVPEGNGVGWSHAWCILTLTELVL